MHTGSILEGTIITCFTAFSFSFLMKMYNYFSMSHVQEKKQTHLNSWNILNILWGSWRAAYPVLMEMISISGFFLIFGKSNGAPPNRFPLSFFWPSSLTEWPSNKAHRPALAWVAQFHFNLLLSTNVLIFSFNFFFYEKKKKEKKNRDVIVEPKK